MHANKDFIIELSQKEELQSNWNFSGVNKPLAVIHVSNIRDLMMDVKKIKNLSNDFVNNKVIAVEHRKEISDRRTLKKIKDKRMNKRE